MSVRSKEVATNGETVKWWIADYTDGAGQRHQRRFKTKREAAAYHDQTKTAIRAGQHVALPQSLTVAGAADKWLAKIAANGRERATLKTYREHVAHITPRIGTLKLAKMSKGHVEAFRNGLITGDKALSRYLARRVLRSFKSILKNAGLGHLRDGIRIAENERHEGKIGDQGEIPTRGEVNRMISAAKPGKLRTLIMVAVATGLRASELRGLRWSDIDLSECEIKVRQRADRFDQLGPLKTKGSRRDVPVGPEVVHALKEWKLACPKGAPNLAFPNGEAGIWNYSNMLRDFEAVQIKAGVVDEDGKPKFGWHALRHFFASWCINPKSRDGRELPAKLVQTLMGHSSIMMTLDIYGHMFPKETDQKELAESTKALFAT